MAFDEGLTERVREVLADRHGVTERKMFGGLAFRCTLRVPISANDPERRA